MAKRGNGEGTIHKKRQRWKLTDGTIKQREIWEGQIFLGYDSNGKMKRKSICGRTRTEVCEKMKILQAKQLKGRLAAPNKIILDQYFKRWLFLKQSTLKRSTYDGYKKLVENRINPVLGEFPLQKITTIHLNDFYKGLLDEGLNPKSVLKIGTVLSGALKLAEQEGYIGFNPALRCQKPKITKKKLEFLTESEVLKLLETAKQYGVNQDGTISKHHNFNMYISILLEIYAGLRRGELLGLKWEYVDFENNQIVVSEALLEIGGKAITDTPKSDASKDRIIALPVSMMEALKAHGEKTKCSEYVFPSRMGGSLHPRNFNRVLKILLDKAGIKKHIRVHDLRHTSASLLVKQNINPYVIQARLGHSDIRTTQIYAHVVRESDIAAAKALECLLQI